MSKNEVFFIVKFFFVWRILLFLFAYLSIYFLPTFGDRFPYAERVLEITKLPNFIWGFGNFDGVHYLRIAQDGYKAQYSQAFFPLYPLLTRTASFLFPKDPSLNTEIFTDPAYFYAGFILSNALFLAALFILYKLFKDDFGEKIAKFSILLFLVFPTSFYFGAIYTESLFLLLSALAVFFLRKGKFLGSAIVISLATATRLIGIFLIPLYLVEVYKHRNVKSFWPILIMPIGIFLYMYYLKANFSDPLYFLTSQPIFGAERQITKIILLPQVVFRYAKILLTVSPISLAFFNAVTETVFTLVPLGLLITLFKKMRLSYWIFSLSTLILPTLTGTLSSMPRYVVISLFLVFPYMSKSLGKYYWLVFGFSTVLTIVFLSLFIRGYWVA